MTAPERPTLDERAKDVAQVSAWGALAITVVTASTANAALQAAVLGLAGGRPQLGVDGVMTIVNAFLITAPLAIAVTIASLGLVRIPMSEDNQMYKVLGLFAVAIVIGLVVGNVIYQSLYSMILEVNFQDLSSTVTRTSGPPYVKLGAAVMWFVVGYYEFFGFGHFVAALIAGGVAAYAAHQLLPRDALA